METFRDIQGYESQYEISNLGRVRNKNKDCFVCIKTGKVGYNVVNLWKYNEYKTFYIHRLTAIHFIDNPKGLDEVNHLDGNKLNNSISNLEWVTTGENVRHAISTGLTPLGDRRKNAKLSNADALEIYRLSHSGILASIIAEMFNISKTQVYQIKNKKEWRHIHD
jgi:hypothetical protein